MLSIPIEIENFYMCKSHFIQIVHKGIINWEYKNTKDWITVDQPLVENDDGFTYLQRSVRKESVNFF